MLNLTDQSSRAQRVSRWLGWALVAVHTFIGIAVASTFGTPGSEWWPVLFYAIDFPASLPAILFFKHIHSFADWGTLGVFLLVGSAWHFYWPQLLVLGIRCLAERFHQPKAARP